MSSQAEIARLQQLIDEMTELSDGVVNDRLQTVMTQDVKEDTGNSSVLNLDAANSYTFTGVGKTTLGVAGLQFNLKTDQNATIYIEQSDDNTNWDISDHFDYLYSKGGMGATVQAVTAYWRIRVVLTGTTDTTYFRLAGVLQRIIVSDNVGGVIIYDNTAASGTIITDLDTAQGSNPLGGVEYGVPFSNGLTIEIDGNVGVTVVYE